MKSGNNLTPIVSVKVNVLRLWERQAGRKPIYRKYSSAKGAARDWAYRKANELYHLRTVHPATTPAGAFITFVYDQPDFKILYDKAYRRSLKIFKAMGLK